MFYEDLNQVLGRLFYYTATVNGKLHHAEKDKLHQLVQTNWIPLEHSSDEFGTDLASQIEFAFDFEETESITPHGLEDFEAFYKQNKEAFTPDIKKNILRTINAIAASYHGQSKKEAQLFHRVKKTIDA